MKNSQFIQTLFAFKRLFLAAVFLGAATWSFFSLAAIASKENEWTGFMYSLILFGSSIMSMLGSYFYSAIVKKKSLLFSVPASCIIAGCIMFLLMLYPNEYFLWVLFGLIDGLFITWVYLTMEGEIYEKAPENTRARSFTMYALTFTVGASIAPLLVNLGGSVGYISAMVFLALTAIFYPKRYKGDGEEDGAQLTLRSIKKLVKRAPFLWSLAIIGGALGETLGAFLAPLGLSWGYSEEKALLFITFAMLGAVFLQYPISSWVDNGWRRGRIWMVLASIIVLFFFVTKMSMHYYAVLFFVFVIGGMATFMSVASLAILADRFEKEDKALAVSLTAMFYAMGNILSPPIIGLSLDTFGGVGVIIAISVLCVIPLAIGFARYKRRFNFKIIQFLYKRTYKRIKNKGRAQIRASYARRAFRKR